MSLEQIRDGRRQRKSLQMITIDEQDFAWGVQLQ